MGEIDVIFGTSKKPKASDVESLKPARAITTKAANTKAQKRTTTSVDNTQQQQQQNTIVAKPKKKKAKVEKIADPLNSDKGIDENKSKKVVETVDFRFAVPTTKPIPLKGKRDDDDGFADSRGMKSGSKRTEDGLRVFYNIDLQIGAGNGDTLECPFDCWCCF